MRFQSPYKGEKGPRGPRSPEPIVVRTDWFTFPTTTTTTYIHRVKWGNYDTLSITCAFMLNRISL